MRRRYSGEEAERRATDGERRLDRTAPAYQCSIPPGITYLARHMRPFDVSSYGPRRNLSKFPSDFEKKKPQLHWPLSGLKWAFFLSQDSILCLSFN